MTWTQKEGLLKLSATKDLLTINNNESVFFGSKMGQTKSKPLRVRYFLRFFTRNCSLHLEHLKKNTRNRILLCKPNNQIIKLKTQCTYFLLGCYG